MRLIDSADTLPAGTRVLDNTEDVAALADQLQPLTAIALQFPKWVDGRAYSQAALLRSRLKFAGELIATGEVVLDMLPLLQRCGFDTAQLVAGQDRAAADRALGFFPGHYQSDPHRLAQGAPA